MCCCFAVTVTTALADASIAITVAIDFAALLLCCFAIAVTDFAAVLSFCCCGVEAVAAGCSCCL